MKIFVETEITEVTNPSNIGSYKNNSNHATTLEWPRKSEIRKGSYVDWHEDDLK